VIVQPWQLSFALSIIVVPIMIILISFKPKLYTLIIYGLITCTAHYFMLKMTYEKITANHLLFVIVNKHLLISICAWLIPTWLMIYAERSNFIRKMLCMDKPL
jgi:hypothetical protein